MRLRFPSSVIAMFMLIWFMLICAGNSHAQDSSPPPPQMQAPNEFLLELGGRCILYSVSYERQISSIFSLNFGVAPYHLGWGGLNNVSLMYSTALNLHLSNAPSRMFVDIGGSYIPSGRYLIFLPSLGAGYRYRPDKSAITFKLQGLVTVIEDWGLLPWAGLAVGYSF